MRSIVADPTLVACCALYCGTCGEYLRENCLGCRQSEKNLECCVRKCVSLKGISTCAECNDSNDSSVCCKFEKTSPRVCGQHFPADRPSCIQEVKHLGLKAYSQKMAVLGHPLFRHP